jgi:tetratricopeptide (TPR) repeat protein
MPATRDDGPPTDLAAVASRATVVASEDRRFSAREHVEEAAEAADTPIAHREELLRRALELWPDCAAAWLSLASLAMLPAGAAGPGERVERLRQAVAAGRRALGLSPDGSPVVVGGSEDARTLLTARDTLARALRDADDEDAALAEERTLLAEDPDDPLGVGVRHVARLLVLGRDAEAAPLLDARAEDAAPGWVWARVLAARRRGDRVAASFALAEATMVASFVGPLLVARGARLPSPEGLSADAFDEARRAAMTLRPAWEATPGALAWLASVLPRPPERSRSAPGPRGSDR